jgi:acyl carrier protein
MDELRSLPPALISCRLLDLGENLGKTMDARATLQLDFDANKVRALIARYLGIDVEELTDEVEFSDAAVDRIEVVGDLIRHIEIRTRGLAA